MVALAKQENDKKQSERYYIAKYGTRVKYPAQENMYNQFQTNTLEREGRQGILWEQQDPIPMLAQKFSTTKRN